MSADLLTRREAAEISGVSLNAVNKAIEQQVVKPTRKGKTPLLEPIEIAYMVLLDQLGLPLPVKTKKALRNWLAHLDKNEIGSQFEVSDALFIAYTSSVADAYERARRYGRLREMYIERNPNVMGGEPVIRGTRVPVRGLARQIEMGEDTKLLSEDYPHIPEEAFEAAVLWAKANPRRGRPTPPWRGSAARGDRRPRPRA